MKKIIFICAMLCSVAVFGKERSTSYNFQRGVEEVNNNNFEEGEKYLTQELSDNPKNGYAYLWLYVIEKEKNEIGNAIFMLNQAIKYIPKSNKNAHAYANFNLSQIYLDLSDTIKAINYMTSAVKAEPKNQEWLVDRGYLYINLEQYELAFADFQQCIKLKPTSINGYIGKGVIYYETKQYEKALEQYEYANRLSSFPFIYSCIAKVEIALHRYEAAAEHIVKSLKEESFEELAFDLLCDANKELFAELMPRIQIQINNNPNNVEWRLYQMYLYGNAKNYEQAILCAEKIKELDPNPNIDLLISSFYQYLGDFSSALHFSQLVYKEDPTNGDCITNLANIYESLDSIEQANKFLNLYIEQNPELSSAYHLRAQFYFFCKNYQSALEDYISTLALNTSDTYARYMRGRTYLAMGDTLKANADFRRVVKDNKNNIETAFSLVFLNQHKEARLLTDSIALADSIDHSEYYNIACCYSLLGESELAFATLEKELQNAHNVRFVHIRKDPDFLSIHGERFDSLLLHYETIMHNRIKAFKRDSSTIVVQEQIVEIPFTAAGGVTKVDCTINELPLSFIFDTGASDVTISQVEANFMYKNGYLSERDIIGEKVYRIADGSISVGTTIVLKEIKFAGLTLKDVRASVVKSQNAPLLLGQTVLQRLGKIEIDNTERILKITTKK